jgi:hypothetical protein
MTAINSNFKTIVSLVPRRPLREKFIKTGQLYPLYLYIEIFLYIKTEFMMCQTELTDFKAVKQSKLLDGTLMEKTIIG